MTIEIKQVIEQVRQSAFKVMWKIDGLFQRENTSHRVLKALNGSTHRGLLTFHLKLACVRSQQHAPECGNYFTITIGPRPADAVTGPKVQKRLTR